MKRIYVTRVRLESADQEMKRKPENVLKKYRYNGVERHGQQLTAWDRNDRRHMFGGLRPDPRWQRP